MTSKVSNMLNEIMEDLSEIEGVSFNQQHIVIPTGIDLLDTIAGGGFPVGKLISIAGSPGGGKCLAAGTPILMYDGTLKNVEDILVGDLIMGDDSTPRKVLATTTGEDEMYRIESPYNDPYIVNSKHILTLKKYNTQQSNYDIVDFNVIDFMNLDEQTKRAYGGYYVDVKFTTKKIPIHPYYLGAWLNSKYDKNALIDIEAVKIPIQNFISEYMRENNNLTTIISNSLHELDLINNKHIPHIYKCNNSKIRWQLLAGILDTGNVKNCDHKGFVYRHKHKPLIDDIIFLVRSLGLVVKSIKTIFYKDHYDNTQKEYELLICGDIENIPIKTNIYALNTQINNDNKRLYNTLKVVPVGKDKYYGFQITGNQRFVLGDFTVTHNSSLAGRIVSGFQKYNEQSMAFYVDSEQAMSVDRLVTLGCDPNRTLLMSQVITLEAVCKIFEKIIIYKQKKKLIDVPFVFIWDSESASPTEKQLTVDDPSKIMGFKARLLSHILPKIAMDGNKYNITPILINQLRDKIDMNMYQADMGGLKGLGDKTITGGNVMKFLPFQLLFVRPRENIDVDKFGFSGVVSELKFVKNKNYIPHIKIDLVLDYMKGYSDFWTKQRLLQNNKAIRGTAWQSLSNCKDKKFRKKEIEELYNTDEEFRKCFEEIYEELKKGATMSSEIEETNKNNMDFTIDDEDDDDDDNIAVDADTEKQANNIDSLLK